MNPPVLIYRVGNFFYKNNFKIISKLISYVNRLAFSVWLPSSATIGKNFTVGYWGLGIVVHSNCSIGNNCQINQHVTIGRKFGEKKVPIIGDDVYVGASSTILGDITIGNNVIIGANTFINKNIPDNCTVAGNPFRIICVKRQKKYYELD